MKSDKVTLSSDKKTATMPVHDLLFRSVAADKSFTEGIHYWEIRLGKDNRYPLKFGITKRTNRDYNTAFSDFPDGYAFFGVGELRNGNNATGEKYGKPCINDTTVGVLLDMNKGILAFGNSEETFGVAYQSDELKSGKITPIVAMIFECSFTLVTNLEVPRFYDVLKGRKEK